MTRNAWVTLAVTYAAENAEKAKALVLLSPGLDYRGVTTEEAVRNFPGNMLFYFGLARKTPLGKKWRWPTR